MHNYKKLLLFFKTSENQIQQVIVYDEEILS